MSDVTNEVVENEVAPETQEETQNEEKKEHGARKIKFGLADGCKAFTSFPFQDEEVDAEDNSPEWGLKNSMLQRKLFANDEVYIAWLTHRRDLLLERAETDYSEAVEKIQSDYDADVEECTKMADMGIVDEKGTKATLWKQLQDKLSPEEKALFAKELMS